MTRVALWALATVMLFGAQSAPADTLTRADGTKVTGTLEEVVFLANEVHGLYARTAIASVQAAKDGNDTVVLLSGGRREGRIVSVRFRSADGLLTVPRAALGALELSADTPAETKEPAPDRDSEKEATPAETEEAKARKAALSRNLALRNSYWDRAEQMEKDEIEALKKSRWDECKRAVDRVARLQDTIERKERRREEEERRWREEERRRRENQGENNTNAWRRPNPRPTYNDGLEEDRRALRKAIQDKERLQREVRGQVAEIERRGSERRRRVEAISARQRRAIEDGHELSAEQMAASYQAALDLQSTKKAEQGKGEAAKKE